MYIVQDIKHETRILLVPLTKAGLIHATTYGEIGSQSIGKINPVFEEKVVPRFGPDY